MLSKSCHIGARFNRLFAIRQIRIGTFASLVTWVVDRPYEIFPRLVMRAPKVSVEISQVVVAWGLTIKKGTYFTFYIFLVTFPNLVQIVNE